MLAFSFLGPGDIARRLAERVKALRRAQALSQEELATRCGMSVGTLRRFESGQTISLDNFVRLVQGLGRASDLASVLEDRPVVTIEQLEALEQASHRKRPYRRQNA